MKRTPFHGIHQSLGAKLIEFGGYEMPVQYPSGIVKEHLAVRSAVGVFDVSHMGEFEVRGKSAMKFLQRVTINDVARLSEGKAQYSAMCYDDGGIVDDLLVYHCGSHYLLVVNASNIAKDFEWLQSHLKGDVTLKDVSDTTALLAIQGPRSLAALQPISDVDLAAIPYYRFVRGTVAGIPMMISRTGYTGELGFELYGEIDDSQAKKLWNSIFDAGKEFGEFEGFSHIVVGARFQPFNLVRHRIAGREHDDRHVAIGSQAPADLHAVQPGQHQVQYHEVRRPLLGHRQRFVAAQRDVYLISFVYEAPPDKVGYVCLILNHQNACHSPLLRERCDSSEIIANTHYTVSLYS